MGSWGRLAADAYLAWRALVAHPLRRAFDTGPRGREKFLAHYAPEGLVPTTPADKAMLAAAGRCIGCGLCDAVDGHLSRLPRAIYGGAALVPLRYARSSVELVHARDAVAAIDPAALRAGEAVCPTRVPLAALAAWLKERLERTAAAGGGVSHFHPGDGAGDARAVPGDVSRFPSGDDARNARAIPAGVSPFPPGDGARDARAVSPPDPPGRGAGTPGGPP